MTTRALGAVLTALLVTAAGAAPPAAITASDVERAPRARAAGALLAALGWDGPLGPWGPLGELGPLGRNPWHPAVAFRRLGDWSAWAGLMRAGGPLGANGPLGPRGPLSDESYDRALPALGPFGKDLQAGGLFTAVGPIGPLAALGPLGPLGPVGAHGHAADASGNFRTPHGDVVRTVRLEEPFSHRGRQRDFELVELYTEDGAARIAENDTSFMAEGAVSPGHPRAYPVRSRWAQFVTAVAVPVRTYAPPYVSTFFEPWTGPAKERCDVDLAVLDRAGRALARSDSLHLIDWVQLRARAGAHLTVVVSARAGGAAVPRRYRLVVVGSTDHIR